MPNKPHIVVRVAPRLLADVLCLALREEGIDVELYLDDDPRSARIRSKRFDVALVTEELPGDVTADTTVVLDPSGNTLTVSREEQHRLLGTDEQLSGLIVLVEELLRDGLVDS